MDCDTVDSNPDYATVHRAMGGKWIAAVMRYHESNDEYRIHVSWGPLLKAEAVARAQQWAREYRIDYRP